MSEEHEGHENGGGEQAISASGPDEGQANAAKSERQVVIHEAHVEDVAVAEHGDERNEEPRRAAADGFHEGENSPEEDQDAERNGEFFGGGEAESFGEIEEQEIEKDVVPLTDGVNAGSFALLHELREPGVVDVAA